MLLVEQVRDLDYEENLIEDDADYSNDSAESWTTIHDYGNITLDSAGIVVFKFEATLSISATGHLRLKIGDNYVAGGAGDWSGINQEFAGMIYLDAGIYNVKIEGYRNNGTLTVLYLYLGQALLSDLDAEVLQASAEKTVNVPDRTLSLGDLKEAILFVNVYYEGAATITVDGESETWSETTESHHYKFYKPVTVGEDHTVSVDNGYMSIMISPWILGALCEPIDLDAPQQSTIYVTLEPLYDDPSGKWVGVGKIRAIDYDANYYDEETGVGIIEFDYTFEIVKMSDCLLLVKGAGGCVSMIGADIR